ncbi:MAG: Asp/Glu/hydantoin racemase, partial [Bradyrhizobium sp.]|nr:Asp/Glu/hydantoin racemase [Bradyrhizobium sp.]
ETPDAIAVVCNNMRAEPLVARLELETGIPILDTIATVVWKSLKLAGVDTRGASEWGSLFQKFA